MRHFWRQETQGLMIGEEIKVEVLEVRLNYVRLGITCLGSSPSYREETVSWEPEEFSAEPAAALVAASRF